MCSVKNLCLLFSVLHMLVRSQGKRRVQLSKKAWNCPVTVPKFRAIGKGELVWIQKKNSEASYQTASHMEFKDLFHCFGFTCGFLCLFEFFFFNLLIRKMKLLLAEILCHYNAFDETDTLAAEAIKINNNKPPTHHTKKHPNPGCLIVA